MLWGNGNKNTIEIDLKDTLLFTASGFKMQERDAAAAAVAAADDDDRKKYNSCVNKTTIIIECQRHFTFLPNYSANYWYC